MRVYFEMEMPKDGCSNCKLVRRGSLFSRICALTEEMVDGNFERGGFPTECPLKGLPSHGRLIDADALITTFCEWGTRLERGRKLVITMSEAKQAIVDIIEDAPTVIPASKEAT